ncbi:MAG: LIM domain-containing protein [Victivallaceae bacterium]|nr:LIM domain-containing protein [Victivallaceae bacterium]
MRKISAIILTCLAVFQLMAATLRCSVCRREIHGRYLICNGKVFCSQKCLDRTLPVCAACHKRCRGKVYTKDGKFYCSEKCLETTFPKCSLCHQPFRKGVVIKTLTGDKIYCPHCAALPRCFACSLPAASGIKLPDGRFLCDDCARMAILTEAAGQELFDQVREEMRRKLNLGTNHKIHFQLVDSKTLLKASANYEPGLEMGLFKHSYTVKTRTETTYSLFKGRQDKTEQYLTNNRYSVSVLSGLPRRKFIEVCAHELAHDWMDAEYPKIKSLKIKEGWAEYVATRVNELYGRQFMNKRMEANTNEIYGDGYRFIRDYIREHGMDGLMRYFSELNK